jgi:hypothetical protein
MQLGLTAPAGFELSPASPAGLFLFALALNDGYRRDAADLLPVVRNDHVDAKSLHFAFMLDDDVAASDRPILQIPFADVAHLASTGELQIDTDPEAHGALYSGTD